MSEELTVTDVKVVNLRTVKHVGKRDVVSTGVVYGLEVGTIPSVSPYSRE